MITVEQFKKRSSYHWGKQQDMAAAKYWKTGKRKGLVRVPAQTIEFTKVEFQRWLWNTVGLSAIPCYYCSTPVDILSLSLDHAIPRVAGGRFAIDNMRICCRKCNERKGQLTAEGFKDVNVAAPDIRQDDLIRQ